MNSRGYVSGRCWNGHWLGLSFLDDWWSMRDRNWDYGMELQMDKINVQSCPHYSYLCSWM